MPKDVMAVRGWCCIGMRIEPDGADGRYIGIHVHRKFKPVVIEYLLGHLALAEQMLSDSAETSGQSRS